MSISPTAKHRNKVHIRPTKRLGQNFLTDHDVCAELVRCARLTPRDHVLEIGAGTGALSTFIAASAGRVYCLEKDRRMEPVLRAALQEFDQCRIIIGDILDFDLGSIAGPEKLTVIGNLPYYITSPILVTLIEQRRYIASMFLTVQKEVAERIVAQPGTKTYGRLSCLMQFYTIPEIVRILPKTLFSPQPAVDSAFLKISLRAAPAVAVSDEKMFFKVIQALFAQRRKTVLNNLANAGWKLTKHDITAVLDSLSIPANLRAEALSLENMGKLSDAIVAAIEEHSL